MTKKGIVAIALWLAVLTAHGQTVQGTVLDQEGNPVAFANVQVQEAKIGSQTDEQGHFSITLPKPGTYSITASFIGFGISQTLVSLKKDETRQISISLKPKDNQLNEVQIVGMSQAREIQEQAFLVSAMDIKKLHNSAQGMNQVLNRVTGVRIREEGGLGSDYTFSLNGFTGKQVKFFMDGVPIDNFGSSLYLSNLPVNLIETIEIYKGVVPVWLGADALGGAVNVATRQPGQKLIDASYSAGSFNTHRASLISSYVNPKNGLTVNANAFFNYSDNNYKINIKLPDPETGKYGEETSIRRFHDAYRSSMAQLEIGATNKKFADRLLLGLILTENKKDIQHGTNMEDVSGMAFNSSHSLISTLKYKKEKLFTKGLSITLNANFSMVKAGVTDTSSREYDWLGNYTVKTFSASGEIAYNKTLFRFNDLSGLAVANASYRINDRHQVVLNHTANYYERKGEDPISKYPIPFEKPNVLKKHISGLAYEFNSTNKRWAATVFAKSFQMTGKTYFAEFGDYESFKTKHNKYGFGVGATYRANDFLRIKASYENAWRLPDGQEMFGDGLLLQNSPNLRPEHSHNANVGAMGSLLLGRHGFNWEADAIYRKSGDFIRLESDGILTQYTNLDSVRTTGIELALKYTYNNIFSVNLNSTYQNIINTNQYDKGIKSFVYLDRLPNIPYLFGNADVGLRLKNVWNKADILTINLGASFIEKFYLFWPSMGSSDSKFIIPAQFTQNAGATYSLKNGIYNIAIECTNLSNARVYDNFRLQKPGRAFQVKFRYFFHQ